jgi:hypothetical protein
VCWGEPLGEPNNLHEPIFDHGAVVDGAAAAAADAKLPGGARSVQVHVPACASRSAERRKLHALTRARPYTRGICYARESA